MYSDTLDIEPLHLRQAREYEATIYGLIQENEKMRMILKGVYGELFALSKQGIFPSLWLDDLHNIIMQKKNL